MLAAYPETSSASSSSTPGMIPSPRRPSPSLHLPSAASTAASSSASTPSTATSSIRKLFPGFLSEPASGEHDLSSTPPGDPSPTSTVDSPVERPNLRESRHQRKAPPPPLFPSSAAGPSRSHTPGSSKRRPSPLNLGHSNTRGVGVDEELQEQRGMDSSHSAPIQVERDDEQGKGTAAANGTGTQRSRTISDDMQDLSLLRHSVRQNLIARPVDSPLSASGSLGSFGSGSNGSLSAEAANGDAEAEAIHIQDVVADLSSSSSRAFVLDTRPLGEFLDAHLPRSANVSIPSLIFKRFRKASGKATTWDALGSFVSTQAGKQVWESVDPEEPVQVYILGLSAADEPAWVLRSIISRVVDNARARVIQGGWASILSFPDARNMLVSGEHSDKRSVLARPIPPSIALSSPQSAPVHDTSTPQENGFPQRILHHPSMPQLRTNGTKRNLPALSIRVNMDNGTSRRPPKLSLNLDRPQANDISRGPASAVPHGFPGRKGNLLDAPHTSKLPPPSPSFYALCHEQSKLPPSPRSFGMESPQPIDENIPSTPFAASFTARPDGTRHADDTPDGGATARHGMSPFIVSTVLPSFLFLGPEITSQEEVDRLKSLGVKRILNVAIECNDEELGLREQFDRYLKLPMRDIVEESGVAKGMRDACEFLDDARLHSAPTYVHCKAGKSRSVTVVLAYLIHANAWTLKTSYAYVAERRRGISPNIGFVAELMQFEEAELGLKQSGGVHGESTSRKGGAGDGDGGKEAEDDKGTGRFANRHTRESLPPAWAAASLDSGRPKLPIHGDEPSGEEGERRGGVGDEREVRKNGQWVHHRRAPVDRTTLQPGRRVSKAGLESLRGFSSVSQSSSPKPSPGIGEVTGKPHTPGGEGRVGWV